MILFTHILTLARGQEFKLRIRSIVTSFAALLLLLLLTWYYKPVIHFDSSKVWAQSIEDNSSLKSMNRLSFLEGKWTGEITHHDLRHGDTSASFGHISMKIQKLEGEQLLLCTFKGYYNHYPYEGSWVAWYNQKAGKYQTISSSNLSPEPTLKTGELIAAGDGVCFELLHDSADPNCLNKDYVVPIKDTDTLIFLTKVLDKDNNTPINGVETSMVFVRSKM